MVINEKKDRERLLEENINLVYSIARRFIGRCEYEDLAEVGKIGLIKAIDGFDGSLGYSFSTYAYPLIIGEIRRFLRDDGIIKVSRSIKKNSQIVLKAKEKYFKEHGKEAKISEISNLTGLSHDDILEALEAASPIMSLQEKIAGDDSDMTLCDLLSDKDLILDMTERFALREALNKLCEFDRRLIELRYFRGLTQCQTATVLGVSQVTVSRGEKKIIGKLREEIVV